MRWCIARISPGSFPGRAPNGVTLETLLYAQVSRNPALAQILYHAGKVESFGMSSPASDYQYTNSHGPKNLHAKATLLPCRAHTPGVEIDSPLLAIARDSERLWQRRV